jgi:hypothetical protein
VLTLYKQLVLIVLLKDKHICVLSEYKTNNMADIEDLQIQFQMLLCQASMDVVKPIAERLGIEKANWKEKKSQMVGLLCKFVDGELDKKETDTQRVQMLQDLIGRCKEMIAQESGDHTAEKEVEAVEGKIKELEEAKAKLESYETYVENWRKAMEQAHQIASQKASKASTKGKRQFDKKARAVLLKQGDRVLVRNLRETGGPGKIRA